MAGDSITYQVHCVLWQIIRERVHPPGPPSTYGTQPPYPYKHVDDSYYSPWDEPVFDEEGRPLYAKDGRRLVRRTRLQHGAPAYKDEEEYYGHPPYVRPPTSWGSRYSPAGEYLGEGAISMGDITEADEGIGRRPVDEVVEIPHVQVSI